MKTFSPSRKYQQPRHQEDQSEDDKQRVTCPSPAGIVEHLSRLKAGKSDCSLSVIAKINSKDQIYGCCLCEKTVFLLIQFAELH